MLVCCSERCLKSLNVAGYIGEFEIVDDHRAGKIVVELNGRCVLQWQDSCERVGWCDKSGTQHNSRGVRWHGGIGKVVDAETYVWISPMSRLEEETWDFEEFVREKMWAWVGTSGEERSDYKGEFVERASIRGRS